MPLIGFTVFKDKILDGSKTQTIRKMRKHPIKKGDRLYLYWHPRQKDCTHLIDTTCSEVFTIRLSQQYWSGRQRLTIESLGNEVPDGKGVIRLWIRLFPEQIEEIAHRDGFKDSDEMLTFFVNHYPLPEVFQVIRWQPLDPIYDEKKS